MESQFARQIRLAVQADALQRAFPGWTICVQNWESGRARIEAVNRNGGDPYALISSDPAELWRELRATALGQPAVPARGPGAAHCGVAERD